jgi:cyclic-di-GMP-binding protein
MAKECSFDVVSQVDVQEIDNAFQQAKKELTQRYDLKDSNASIDYDKGAGVVTIVAPSDFVISQVKDIFETKLIRRKVEIKSFNWGATAPSAGGNVTRKANVIQGIDQDLCKRINKEIKAEKFKVKVVIEQDKLRVSSASKDELQKVIAFLRDKDYDRPLQFNNYR